MSQPKKKVLLVDDDPDDLKLIQRVLEAHQFDCLAVLSPIAGLEMALSWQPDLILLDLMLPMMSGFGCLRELKRNPQTNPIPVVVLTTLGDAEIASVTEDIGASAYLTKDRVYQDLITTVSDHAA